MSLPTATAMPTFSLTLPGTEEKVKFRPFIVKEHKMILEANALDDKDHLLDVLIDIMTQCTFNSIDISKLPTYQFDYIFLNIKAKSSGEIVPVTYTCPVGTCGKQTVIELNITNSTIVFPDGFEESKLIIIDEARRFGMKLRVPSFKQMQLLAKQTAKKDSTFIDIFAYSAIESIFDGDKIYTPGTDYTASELSVFLDEQREDIVAKLSAFVESIPYVALQMKVRCPHCGNRDELEIKNLEDFFV